MRRYLSKRFAKYLTPLEFVPLHLISKRDEIENLSTVRFKFQHLHLTCIICHLRGNYILEQNGTFQLMIMLV
jgi:hypothetical protein